MSKDYEYVSIQKYFETTLWRSNNLPELFKIFSKIYFRINILLCSVKLNFEQLVCKIFYLGILL